MRVPLFTYWARSKQQWVSLANEPEIVDYKCTKCYIKFDSFDELKTNELTHTTSGINEVTWDKNKNTIIPTNNKNIKPFSFVTCDKEFDKFNLMI